MDYQEMNRWKEDSQKDLLHHPSYNDCDCASICTGNLPEAVTHLAREPRGGYSTHLRECLAHPRETVADRKRKVTVRSVKARQGYTNIGIGTVFDPWNNCFCDMPKLEVTSDLPPVKVRGQPCAIHTRCCWYCHCGLLIEASEKRRRRERRNKGERDQDWMDEDFCDNPDCAFHDPLEPFRADWKSCTDHDQCCQVCHTEMLKAEDEDLRERRRLISAKINPRRKGGIIKAGSRNKCDGENLSSTLLTNTPTLETKRKKRESKNMRKRMSEPTIIEPFFDPFLDCICDLLERNQSNGYGKCSEHAVCCHMCHEPRLEGNPREQQHRKQTTQDSFSTHSSPSKVSTVQVVIVSPSRPVPSPGSHQPTKVQKNQISGSRMTSSVIKRARKSESSMLRAAKIYTKQECAELFTKQGAPRAYDSQTIARDILRAVGIHPTLPPLNAHVR